MYKDFQIHKLNDIPSEVIDNLKDVLKLDKILYAMPLFIKTPNRVFYTKI